MPGSDRASFFSKKVAKNFASLENFTTFAVPFETQRDFLRLIDNIERLKVQASTGSCNIQFLI